MSGVILFFWFLRVVTISFDSSILRLGVPVFLLSLTLLFVIINRGALVSFLKSPITRSYLGLFGIALVSTAIAFLNSMPLASSLSELMKLMLMGAFLFLGFILTLYGKRHIALFTLSFAIFLHISIGLFGYFLGLGVEVEEVFRPIGITGRVNILANIALFSCVFFTVRWLMESRHRGFFLYMAVISFALIIASGTLKNIISLAGVIGIYVILSSKRKFLAIFTCFILAVPTSYIVVMHTPIGDRIVETFVAGVDLEVEEGQKLESSFQWRVLHWKLLLDDWYARFRYKGAGFGQEVNMNALKLPSGQGYSAHSDWVKYWVELGPVLFTIFVFLHYRLVKPLYQAKGPESSIEKATLYTFLAMLIAMLAGPVYYTISFFYFFWLLMGIIAGQQWLRNSEQEKKLKEIANV
ncbi:O-antigen ligase family protein [Thalassotalea montiporae]